MSAGPNILYEDAALLVVDKPAGLSSEELPGADCLPARLRRHLGDPGAFLGILHRLDLPVSGLMVYAKTPRAAAALSRQITDTQHWYAVEDGRESGPRTKEPTFLKEYRAVLAGQPDETLPAEGTLRDYLFKDSRRGRVFAVDRPRKGVREAVLTYRIAAVGQAASLAEITLHTGRTHQIRVQFASRRHPLLGDGKYGSRWKGPIALQSAHLRFLHPDTGRVMEFRLPPPECEPWGDFAPDSVEERQRRGNPSSHRVNGQ